MEMLAALDDLEAAWDKLASVPLTTLSAGQVLAVLDRLETQRRRQPAIEHTLLNQLQAQATAKDMGAKSAPGGRYWLNDWESADRTRGAD
jgi:hypothetical protein